MIPEMPAACNRSEEASRLKALSRCLKRGRDQLPVEMLFAVYAVKNPPQTLCQRRVCHDIPGYYLFLLRRLYLFEEIPEIACQEDGRVGTADDAHHKRQGKIADACHAQDIKHEHCDKGRQ